MRNPGDASLCGIKWCGQWGEICDYHAGSEDELLYLIEQAEAEERLAKDATEDQDGKPLGFQRWRDQLVATRGALSFLYRMRAQCSSTKQQ